MTKCILYISGLIMFITLFVSPPIFIVLLFLLVFYGLDKTYDTYKKGEKVNSNIVVSTITTVIPCIIGVATVTFVVCILYLLYCLFGQFLFFII